MTSFPRLPLSDRLAGCFLTRGDTLALIAGIPRLSPMEPLSLTNRAPTSNRWGANFLTPESPNS